MVSNSHYHHPILHLLLIKVALGNWVAHSKLGYTLAPRRDQREPREPGKSVGLLSTGRHAGSCTSGSAKRMIRLNSGLLSRLNPLAHAYIIEEDGTNLHMFPQATG